jgi:hypothetical protein
MLISTPLLYCTEKEIVADSSVNVKYCMSDRHTTCSSEDTIRYTEKFSN